MTASLVVTGIVACDGITDPGPGDPVDLTYALCGGAPNTPSWFAFQDGDGAWTRVTPTSSGAFNFTVTRGRGGIAMFTANGGLSIFYATTAEMQDNLPNCAGAVRDVAGTVTGYASTENTEVAMGSALTTVFGFQTAPTSFSLTDVDPDVVDLVATRYRQTSTSTTVESFPTSVFHRRDVTGNSAAINFGSSDASVPLQRTLNVTNLVAGEQLGLESYLATSTTIGRLSQYVADPAVVSGSVIAPFYGVAGSRLVTGETHLVFVLAERTVGSTTEQRRAAATFTDPSDQSLSFGPALASVIVNGSARPSATYTVQTAYDNYFEAAFEQGNGSAFRAADILATKGYFDASPSVTLSVPDLSGVAGFQSSWLLVPGVASRWRFLASSADIALLSDVAMPFKAGYRQGAFTP